MTDAKNIIVNAKDKVVGEVKEAVGKITGNEELELKGKLQSSAADLKKKGEELKEDIVGTINDIIDKKEDK